MVFGSFDVVHDGHRSLFKQAKRHGDKLIVVIARDDTYETLRHYKPLHDENERLQSVASEELVDEAILGERKDYYRVIRQHRPNIICLGYDQKDFIDDLEKQLALMKLDAKIIRLESYNPEKLKSSIIKKMS